jgi:hypothetical protein
MDTNIGSKECDTSSRGGRTDYGSMGFAAVIAGAAVPGPGSLPLFGFGLPCLAIGTFGKVNRNRRLREMARSE